MEPTQKAGLPKNLKLVFRRIGKQLDAFCKRRLLTIGSNGGAAEKGHAGDPAADVNSDGPQARARRRKIGRG